MNWYNLIDIYLLSYLWNIYGLISALDITFQYNYMGSNTEKKP